MKFKIGNKPLGRHVFIIAEIGGNHNGDFEKALSMITKAAECGVDAVKFQTYRAEALVLKSLPAPAHVQGKYKTHYERLKSLQFNANQWHVLKEKADREGVIFLSSAFDEESAGLLAPLVPAFKIASGDLNNSGFLDYIRKFKKPVILSCGMAGMKEIEVALDHLDRTRVILLHCISNYPTAPSEANLKTIRYLQDKFNLPVGYSDHTKGINACVAAAAMGSVVLEKHFTLDKSQPIGDHQLSADPADMAKLVRTVREIETMLGQYGKPVDADNKNSLWLRRSIYARCNIPAGTILNRNHFILLRPADGIPADELDDLIGQKAKISIPKDERITLDMFI